MAEMSIARGMTRLKTINDQLIDIANKIEKYGAWNNQKKIDIVDTRKDIKTNHSEARQEIISLYQKFNDLSEQFVKIKNAITKANLETNITIAEKTMTIADALVYKRHIHQYARLMISAYNSSVSSATDDVERFNRPIMSNNNYDDSKKKELLADILYLVPVEEVKNLNKFELEFLSELNGLLNEVNATTMITVEN